MSQTIMRAIRCGLLGCALLAGCTVETPTEIGGPLVPGGDIQTYEVILTPDQFLEFDTAFAGYVTVFQTSMRIVARNFEGALNSNSLLKFTGLPTTLVVRDAAGALRTDSTPRFPTGRLLLRIDTVRSRGAAELGVYRIGETWDPPTSSWTTRVDTGNVLLNWAQPGGTRGPLVGRIAWQPGTDSLVIPLDSTMILALTRQDSAGTGAMITLESAVGTGGAMLHVSDVTIQVDGKSTIRTDTTIALTSQLITSNFVFTPEPPKVNTTARVSGVPAWRGVLGLKPLRDLRVPCPGTNCTVSLTDAHINLAELLLQPAPSPAGFSPEDSIRVFARVLLETAGVPLERSPIVDPPIDATRIAIARNRFLTGDTGGAVGLPITPLVSAIVTDTATIAANKAPRRIALATAPEAATFGFATFLTGPRLRLVLTISKGQ
jgi:hypothetical protein